MENMKHRILALGLLAIITALSASGCGAAPAGPQPTAAASPTPAASGITAEGRLEPVRFAELALATDGSVSELLAKEGDTLQAGQVIARLKNDNAQTLEQAQASAATRVAAAYQSVREAQTKLDDFEVPNKFSGMSPLEAARTTLDRLNKARATFEPYKDLSRKSLRPIKPWYQTIAPRVVLDTGEYTGLAYEYKKQLDTAWMDYRRAVEWLKLEAALEGAQAELAQAQSNDENLKDTTLAENTAGARAALANAELRSPFAGLVTNLDLKVGQAVAAGKPVVTVADFSSWVVKTTDLTETNVVNIRPEQPVTVTLDAVPGAILKASVISIAQDYAEKQGDVVYEVTVLLTEAQPAMRWGMTAQVHFDQ